MTRQIIPVDPFDYVIFGGTGDLAQRKLLPALYHRDFDGQLPDAARLIGASRSDLTAKQYQDFARKALETHVPEQHRDETSLVRFLQRLDYIPIDATSNGGWDELKSTLETGDDGRIRAFYLAVGPGLFGPIAAQMDNHGLIDDRTRLVIEKTARPGSCLRAGIEQGGRRSLSGRPGFPHRPLSWQGDGAEPVGAALRQCLV